MDFEVLGVSPSRAGSGSSQDKYIAFLEDFKSWVVQKGLDDHIWYVWLEALDEPESLKEVELISLYSDLTSSVNTEEFAFQYRVDGSIDWDSPFAEYDLEMDVSEFPDLSEKFTI